MIDMNDEVFSEKNYEEGLNLNARLTELGHTWDELREWFEDQKRKRKAMIQRCPDCGSRMMLYAEHNEDDFCHWECSSKKGCGKGIPVNHSYDQEIKERLNA